MPVMRSGSRATSLPTQDSAVTPKSCGTFARKTSKLVQSQKAMPSPLTCTPFFDLPGEIRNRIYDLAIEPSQIALICNQPNKELTLLRNQNPHSKSKRPRSRLLAAVIESGSGRSMLFVCRQMYEEVLEMVYARTTFTFNSMRTIHKFINNIPTAGSRSIQSVEIFHKGYAEPQWTDDREWKLRHDEKWAQTLSRIRASMSSLECFKLKFTFFDWPCQLDVAAPWAKTLIRFAGDGLHKVEMIVDHDRFSDEKNKEISRNLEKRMMTRLGWQMKIRDERRQAKLEKEKREQEKLAQRKATKVLTIRLPLSSMMGPSPNVPIKKVVKSKGLEQYATRQPPVAYC